MHPEGNVQESKPISDNSVVQNIESVQRGLIYALLIIFPIAVLPFPGAWATYLKGMLLIGAFILLVGLNLVKLFFTGEIAIFKSRLDYVFALIGSSVLLSTVLSEDLRTSLMGYDLRVGGGALSILALIGLMYIVRSNFSDHKYLAQLIFFSAVGLTLSAFVGLLGFMGVNYMFIFRDLFPVGFVTFETNEIAMGSWIIGILLSIIGSVWFGYDNQENKAVLMYVFAVINGLAIALVSITQGYGVLILTGIAMVAVAVLLFSKRSLGVGKQSTYVMVLTGLLLASVVLFQVPSFKENLAESTNITAQVKLNGELTWNIVTSNLSRSVRSGLIGLGPDTFGIYFNIFKPAFAGDFDLSGVTFLSGSSEILTVLGNQGIVGVVAWISVGAVILYVSYSDFLASKKNNNVLNLMILLLDIGLIYIFVISLFIYLGIVLYFFMLLLITINVLVRSVFVPTEAEAYKLKMNLFEQKVGKAPSLSFEMGLSAIVVMISGLLLLWWGNQLVSAMRVMNSEVLIVQYSEKYSNEDDPDVDEVKEDIANAIDTYGRAVEGDPDNYLYRRRRSLLLLDYIEVLVTQINDATAGQKEGDPVSDEVKQLQAELTRTVEITIEESKKATELGPNIFANWDVRGVVYTNFVGFGVAAYADPGLNVLNTAAQLNPNNYLTYYRAAQLYIAKEDLSSAEGAISSGLNINPNHIPSILLAGEISISAKKYEQATQLFQLADEILVEIESDDQNLKDYIAKRLEDLKDPAKLEAEIDQATGNDVKPDDVTPFIPEEDGGADAGTADDTVVDPAANEELIQL